MSSIDREGPHCPIKESPIKTADFGTWEEVKQVTKWFRKEMLAKLEDNQHKGNREGWLAASFSELTDSMLKEYNELLSAMVDATGSKDNEALDYIIEECADLANFAMMIADKARTLKHD